MNDKAIEALLFAMYEAAGELREAGLLVEWWVDNETSASLTIEISVSRQPQPTPEPVLESAS